MFKIFEEIKMNKMKLNILCFVKWLYFNKQIDVREEYTEFFVGQWKRGS